MKVTHKIQIIDEFFEQFTNGRMGRSNTESLNQVSEAYEPFGTGRSDFWNFRSAGGRFKQCDALDPSPTLEVLLRRQSDAAPRIIDNSTKRHGIFRIRDQAEVGQNVLDFPTLVKTHAANHLIRHTLTAEGVFHRSCLGVRAVKNSTPTV